MISAVLILLVGFAIGPACIAFSRGSNVVGPALLGAVFGFAGFTCFTAIGGVAWVLAAAFAMFWQGYAAAAIASEKRRSPLAWSAAGTLLGVIAIIAVTALPINRARY